jgi:three-Cys-motif partner protein
MTTRRATSRLELDEVGQWSELKIAIIKKYANAFTTILHKHNFRPIYIDGFAGAGRHISKASGAEIDGSPSVAFAVDPPFAEFHLVDLDGHRVENLRQLAKGRSNVKVHHGDCNDVLINKVFPSTLQSPSNRSLAILDPYGLHLDWEVIEAAGRSGKAEIFLNFPVADMNRNVFWHNPQGVDAKDIDRMNRLWGDESWRKIVYTEIETLFGPETGKDGNATAEIAKAFGRRLKQVAGFKFVAEPVPMRNSRNATIYYLFFATQNSTGNKIVSEIFAKYKRQGAF